MDGVCPRPHSLLLINANKTVTLDQANVLSQFVLPTIGLPDLRPLVMMPCKEVEVLEPLSQSLMEDMTVVLLQPTEDLTDILLPEFGGSKIFITFGLENMLLL